MTPPPPAVPSPHRPRTRAEVEAKWRARDARTAFARASDPWAESDPCSRRDDAVGRWQALVDAGLIGG
jgi:hypothetical protein